MSEPLTIEEAATRLGISIATARRWAAEGRIPAEKSGKQWVVDGSRLGRPHRRRRLRGRQNLDLPKALQHVKKTDLAEIPVPDVLRYGDSFADPVAVARGAQKILEGAPPGPPVDVEVDKSAIFTRRVAMLSLPDRVAYQAAVATFAEKVEEQTPEQVFSARLATDGPFFLKRGTHQWVLWRKSVLSQIDSTHEWLVTTDLVSYFDTIPHRPLLSEIQSLNPSGPVLVALREMLDYWSPSEGFGLPQGPNASRVLGNLYLLPIDRAMLSAGWRYSRFMDDVRIVTPSRAKAVEALRQFQQECRRRGLVMSASKTTLLRGTEARRTLTDASDLSEVDYLVDSNMANFARRRLKRILKKALSQEAHIDIRRAKFSLFRLAKYLEPSVLNQVLERLEDLAPISSIVAAYLGPFTTRKRVVKALATFLDDPARSYSEVLTTWLLAAMLERPGTLPVAWVNPALRRLKNRNEPVYLRAVAAIVVARGERSADLSWIKRAVHQEHDPMVLRGYAVALHSVKRLDRNTERLLSSKDERLIRTLKYLKGRNDLPSLVYPDKRLKVS